MLPKVSCVCPTFARAYLLEEAVESFLRQDYAGESELVICNDFDSQRLVFEHPNVRVANLQGRQPNLGAKRHVAIGMASGDFLLTWGDDDIHLPGRIRRMVEFVTANGGKFAFEGPHFCFYGNKMVKNTHPTVGAHIISREFYYECGGIPEQDHAEDLAFNRMVESKIGRLPCCQSEPQFIYRWSSGRPHVSAVAASKEHRDRPWDRMHDVAMEMVGKGMEPSGEYALSPQWRQDWIALTEAAI